MVPRNAKLIIASPPECVANNCGPPANLGRSCLGANTLNVSGGTSELSEGLAVDAAEGMPHPVWKIASVLCDSTTHEFLTGTVVLKFDPILGEP